MCQVLAGSGIPWQWLLQPTRDGVPATDGGLDETAREPSGQAEQRVREKLVHVRLRPGEADRHVLQDRPRRPLAAIAHGHNGKVRVLEVRIGLRLRLRM